ncbi:redoxin domain-containing protein [Paenibacillus abyssi]|uniref:Thiol-disulfide oxidoreductase ResA n=1 Tax=Paenibacillus abyssi TaxID=1340531 RepID=A0A917CH23_9BACL|nr:redoxin domain-containing protein [Paenibacillus abyssi]GGF87580.1 thiol-disulfide oxidoreductase ResA [Paenibacillus abyssi]
MGASRKTVQIVILIGVLLIGGYAIGKTLFADDQGPPGVGDRPPDFSLLGMDGEVHNLSDYEGKALVINFWGTFCPPCVEEMPEFQRQYEKWRGEDFDILAINLSEADLPVANFVRQMDLDYPLLRDVNRRTERNYGLRSYPTTFFVKKDGTIMEVFVGGMTEEQINERVERLLET